jgi:hypothetical protein
MPRQLHTNKLLSCCHSGNYNLSDFAYRENNTLRTSSSNGPAETFIMPFFTMNAIESEEILPGTEVMRDHDGIHFIHARNTAHGPVLLPTPSEHSHDPLVGATFPCAFQKNNNQSYNWNKFWKPSTIISQGMFVLISVATNLSIAPLAPIYVAEWNKSLSQIALLVSLPIRAAVYLLTRILQTGACVIALDTQISSLFPVLKSLVDDRLLFFAAVSVLQQMFGRHWHHHINRSLVLV